MITFPTNTYEVIDAIRGAIGREVHFYTNSPITCSACSLDPVTNTSTNPFCVVCSGLHYIPNYTDVTVSAHITWSPAETMQWVSAGQMYTGDCRVQISYTPEHISMLENTDYVVVDTKRFNIKSQTYRGVPALNRILIDLVEEE